MTTNLLSPSDFYISDLPLQFGGLCAEENKIKDDPIERDLYLSLDDMFHGCTKKVKISRKVICKYEHVILYSIYIPVNLLHPICDHFW